MTRVLTVDALNTLGKRLPMHLGNPELCRAEGVGISGRSAPPSDSQRDVKPSPVTAIMVVVRTTTYGTV